MGSATEGIGTKRLVVGAHYGVSEWLAQRITAVVLAVFVLLLFFKVMRLPYLAYDSWAAMFAPIWMKVVTLVAIFALLYHAWIGVRDIWMDYIGNFGIRLGLQVLTILWLTGCAVWSVQILWRV